jgi:RND superfamily putative drug exporter
LFYVRREREERAAGRSAEEALRIAAATSGRSVLISGLTVMVAVAGMFFAGAGDFRGVAMGTILVVATSVVGSLTVLPALLSKIGDRIEFGRIPLLHRLAANSRGESRFWSATTTRVLRRPAVTAIAAGAVLVGLALPMFKMHTVQPGFGDYPQSMPILQTYDRLQHAFPGGPAPAEVVVRAEDVHSQQFAQAVERFRAAALATHEAFEPISAQALSADVAVISVPLAGTGQDTTSVHALQTLREQVIPATMASAPGIHSVAVGGSTASSADYNTTMKSHIGWVFGFVLGAAFLLLLVTFRSVVIAIKAIVLNMLSVGAAYGVIVAGFQWGWAQRVLGFHSVHGIASWIPLFLFVVLFGLSMDYHVFILSRVREARERGMTTAAAVEHGVKTTAGVVTSAAAVMVIVFSLFGSLSQVSMKEIGMGLAVAVLLDATLVRAVLLPATMRLLGDWNWWLPRRLSWLPRVSLEHPEPEPAM